MLPNDTITPSAKISANVVVVVFIVRNERGKLLQENWGKKKIRKNKNIRKTFRRKYTKEERALVLRFLFSEIRKVVVVPDCDVRPNNKFYEISLLT